MNGADALRKAADGFEWEANELPPTSSLGKALRLVVVALREQAEMLEEHA